MQARSTSVALHRNVTILGYCVLCFVNIPGIVAAWCVGRCTGWQGTLSAWCGLEVLFLRRAVSSLLSGLLMLICAVYLIMVWLVAHCAECVAWWLASAVSVAWSFDCTPSVVFMIGYCGALGVRPRFYIGGPPGCRKRGSCPPWRLVQQRDWLLQDVPCEWASPGNVASGFMDAASWPTGMVLSFRICLHMGRFTSGPSCWYTLPLLHWYGAEAALIVTALSMWCGSISLVCWLDLSLRTATLSRLAYWCRP